VPVKGIAHQAIASLHCLRSTWLSTRTARLNTIRGLLREFGIFVPVGAHHVVPRVRALLVDDPTAVPMLLHKTLTAACDEIDGLETNMHAVERQLASLASEMADVTLLQPYRASASSPPRRSSPWSQISDDFDPAGISPASWD